MVLDGNNVSKYSDNNKAKINLGLNYLNIFCKYILQDSRLLRMEHMVHLRRLLYSIDRSTYENDPEQVKRMNFLMKALEARLDYNLTDRDLILTHINGGIDAKLDFIDYDNIAMTKSEVQWCHQLVEDLLKYSFFFNESNNLQDLLTRFNTADISKKTNIIHETESLIDRIKNEFRKVHVEQNLNDVTFSLDDGVFESAITDTYNMVTNPSRRLFTGMQGLNQMIGGGFESGRVYMFLGVAGVGKSLTLLNLICQIKKYNALARPKDFSKKPCIVLLTMENTVVETITRMFDMVVDNSKGMSNYELGEVIYKMRTEGGLSINDSSPVDIIVRYKANRSVSTDYLYTLYDDIADQGKEMICLIQDHIKRIRSVDYQSDLRLELGDVVNELKVFAAEKDIPVITVSHLNREASRIVEEAARKGSADSGKLIGKSNVGESLLMIDNLDCGITLSRDYDQDGNCYMTFHRIKMRDKGSTCDYIAQPFLIDNPIRLVEDVGGVPQYKESLHVDPSMNSHSYIKMSGASSLGISSIDNVIDKEDLSDNVFKSNKEGYTLGPISENIDSFQSVNDDFGNDLMQLMNQINGNNNVEKHCPVTFGEPFTVEIPDVKFE